MPDPERQPIAALLARWRKQAEEQRELRGLEHQKLAVLADMRADELEAAIAAQVALWEADAENHWTSALHSCARDIMGASTGSGDAATREDAGSAPTERKSSPQPVECIADLQGPETR